MAGGAKPFSGRHIHERLTQRLQMVRAFSIGFLIALINVAVRAEDRAAST